ncbi:MAG: ribbon-helix-helix domain-containing protein [Alphaproteobacteria bacterium]|jgi:predicted DNA-binding ribbon-helix-helix protein
MSVKKYSVMIAGHRTSISLEPEFWEELKILARQEKLPFSALITRIDERRDGNLSSALRLYVLRRLKQQRDCLDG